MIVFGENSEAWGFAERTEGILRVLHIITGLNDGGAEGVLFRLVSHHQAIPSVVVSLVDGGKYKELLSSADIRTHSLGLTKNFLSIFRVGRLVHVIKAEKPDLIQTWLPHANLLGTIAGRLAGVKRIFWGIRHSEMSGGRENFLTNVIIHFLALFSHSIPTAIVSCAEAASRYHIGIGYSAKKFVLIPNGYEGGCASKKDGHSLGLRTELGIEQDQFVVGMVARFHEQKDHYNLLLALSMVKERGLTFRVLLAGDRVDSDNQSLITNINKLGLVDEIFLLGRRDDVGQIFRSIDVHVLSSAFGEGFPNVVAESMAVGIRQIVTRVGDSEQIVSSSGWVVPPRRPAELADAIEEAFHESLTERIGKERLAKNIIRKFYGLDLMVEAYHSLYTTHVGEQKELD